MKDHALRPVAIALPLLAVICFVPRAVSGAAFGLAWTDTTGSGSAGGGSIIAQAGDVLTLGIFLLPGVDGVSLFRVSIQFDDAELSVFSPPTEILPAEFGDPLDPPGVQIIGSPPGPCMLLGGFVIPECSQISSFDAATFPAGSPGPGFLGPPGLQIGEVRFLVIAPATDGPDVLAAFGDPADTCLNNSDQPCNLTSFANINVNVVPEPATALLCGLGLAGIAAWRRKGHHRALTRV